MSHFAYVTSLVRESDLPGVVILAYSLRKYASHIPLIVACHSKTVSSDVVAALKDNVGKQMGIIVEVVDPNATAHGINLDVPDATEGDGATTMSGSNDSKPPVQPTTVSENAESSDTYFLDPSLLAFSPPLWTYETVCYLSPTSLVTKNGMDLIFSEAQLPTNNCIAAVPLCTCSDTTPSVTPNTEDKLTLDTQFARCPYRAMLDPRTPLRRTLSFSASVAAISPIAAGEMAPRDAKLDGRVVVFYPGEMLWDKMREAHVTGDNADIQQSSLIERVFKDKWAALPWYYSVSEKLCLNHPELIGDDGRNVVCVQVDSTRSMYEAKEKKEELKEQDENPKEAETGPTYTKSEDKQPLSSLSPGEKNVSSSTASIRMYKAWRCSVRRISGLEKDKLFVMVEKMTKGSELGVEDSDNESASMENEKGDLLRQPSFKEPLNAAKSRISTADRQGFLANLSPIAEASPINRTPISRSFETAYQTAFHPKHTLERGHGPVAHQLKADMDEKGLEHGDELVETSDGAQLNTEHGHDEDYKKMMTHQQLGVEIGHGPAVHHAQHTSPDHLQEASAPQPSPPEVIEGSSTDLDQSNAPPSISTLSADPVYQHIFRHKLLAEHGHGPVIHGSHALVVPDPVSAPVDVTNLEDQRHVKQDVLQEISSSNAAGASSSSDPADAASLPVA
jgi:inositol 3-alpha-galactosyltransferase